MFVCFKIQVKKPCNQKVLIFLRFIFESIVNLYYSCKNYNKMNSKFESEIIRFFFLNSKFQKVKIQQYNI